jgi:hypothetical protein
LIEETELTLTQPPFSRREESKLSDQLIKIKRESEYKSWMILNQAATNIQKVFKRFSEKDHLLTLINDRYKRDMRQPTLLLQSIYRQMKVS